MCIYIFRSFKITVRKKNINLIFQLYVCEKFRENTHTDAHLRKNNFQNNKLKKKKYIISSNY